MDDHRYKLRNILKCKIIESLYLFSNDKYKWFIVNFKLKATFIYSIFYSSQLEYNI